MFASMAVLVVCHLMIGPIQPSQGIPSNGGPTDVPTQTEPQRNGVIQRPSVTSIADKPQLTTLYASGPNDNSTSQASNQDHRPFNLSQNLSCQRNETESGHSVSHAQNPIENVGNNNHYKKYGQKINAPLQRNYPYSRYPYLGSPGGSQAVGGRPVTSFKTKDYPSIHVGNLPYGHFPYLTDTVALGLGNSDRTTETSVNQGSVVGIDKEESPGNTKTKENKHLPWQVSVFSKTYEPFRRICGGSMVSRKAVISAAYCFWDESEEGSKSGLLPASQFAVGAGEILPYRMGDYNRYRQQNDVAAIKVPLTFSGYTSGYRDDIAVVLLARPFFDSRGMRPVCISFDRRLEERQLRAGNIATTLGVNYVLQEERSNLQVLRVSYIPVEDCKAALRSDSHYMTEDKICAGFKPLSPILNDMCSQDGGAGLAFHLGDDHDQAKGIAVPFLRGVASRSRPCDALTPTFYTRLSAHRGFLKEHLGDVEAECGKYYPQLGALLEEKETRDVQATELVCNCYC